MWVEEHRDSSEPVVLSGEMVRLPAWGPVRVLLVVSGLILVRDILTLLARYALGLRARATASIQDRAVTLTLERAIFGRRFRRSKTVSPIRDLKAVRFENRQRYLYLLVGFGALVVGVLIGMQWFLEGLRAGYPYLVSVGAAIISAGIAIDAVVFLFIPKGTGRSHLVLALGPWVVRIVGVDTTRAERFLNAAQAGWSRSPPGPRLQKNTEG